MLLQNCHLGLEFMDELLNTITEAESMHESCRVWITTEVHPKFPISLLQVSKNYNKTIIINFPHYVYRLASNSRMSPLKVLRLV